MKEIFQTRQFRKDLKRSKKRGKDIGKLKDMVRLISAGGPMEGRHRDHALMGQ